MFNQMYNKKFYQLPSKSFPLNSQQKQYCPSNKNMLFAPPKILRVLIPLLMLKLITSFCTAQSQRMIYFIRHAESKYNTVDSDLKTKFGTNYAKEIEYITHKFSKDYLDVEITGKGIQQALEAREKMKDIDIDLIIVSPLRRALMTCELIFENHKSNAPVIVDPAFREVLSSSNDIGSKLVQSKTRFTKFDFSLITDPDFWYLQTIHDQEIRQRLMKKVQEVQHENKIEAGIQITIQFLKEYFKLREEDPTNHLLIKKVLPSLKKQKEILEQKLKKYRTIAVVSHSENIREYVGYKPNNCEIVPFTEDQLKNLEINE